MSARLRQGGLRAWHGAALAMIFRSALVMPATSARAREAERAPYIRARVGTALGALEALAMPLQRGGDCLDHDVMRLAVLLYGELADRSPHRPGQVD